MSHLGKKTWKRVKIKRQTNYIYEIEKMDECSAMDIILQNGEWYSILSIPYYIAMCHVP
jgi:hypothetical protein